MDERYAETLRKQKAKRKAIDKIRKEKSKKVTGNNIIKENINYHYGI